MIPVRLTSSPARDALERGAAKKNYRIRWIRTDGQGLRGLRLEAYDRDDMQVQRFGIAKRADRFDEAQVAEAICEWILEGRSAQVAISGSSRR